MAANPKEMLHDFFPLLIAFKDGRILRLTGQDFVPPSIDPETGVKSKDTEISLETGVSARLYLPEKPNYGEKLPILFYFHGGGFVVESPFTAVYHRYLNLLVAKARVLAVSINYRLAPEHLLPTAYDDSWLAFTQLLVDGDTHQWIRRYADFGRMYLGGDSAGANIAHNMAMRVGSMGLDLRVPISIRGLFLNCPFFGGEDPIGNEDKDENAHWKYFFNGLWLYAFPNKLGRDDPRVNPARDPNLRKLGCTTVLVIVGGLDFLKDRGVYYDEKLRESRWGGDGELVEVAGENHVFGVLYPDSEDGQAMLKKVADFINQ